MKILIATLILLAGLSQAEAFQQCTTTCTGNNNQFCTTTCY